MLSSVNKADGELGELEEQDLNLSIKHYRKAVDTVKESKMQENFTWDLINAQLKLATMLQECPPGFLSTNPEFNRIKCLDARFASLNGN